LPSATLQRKTAGMGRNAGAASHVGPSAVDVRTPSVAHACRCTWRFSGEPKRCRKKMPPSCGCGRASVSLFPGRLLPAFFQRLTEATGQVGLAACGGHLQCLRVEILRLCECADFHECIGKAGQRHDEVRVFL